jgi:Fe-Mn family superoxide dismutase
MALTLPDLPFTMDALEPHISRKTIEYHYGKHHAAYVEKPNTLILDNQFEKIQIELIIQTTHPIKAYSS